MEKIRKIKADLSEMHNAKVYELQECLGKAHQYLNNLYDSKSNDFSKIQNAFINIANKYVSWWKNFSLEN